MRLRRFSLRRQIENMDVKKLIIDKIKKRGEVSTAEIVKAVGFSRAYINRFLKELRWEGKIELIGKANTARYILAERKTLDTAKRRVTALHRILRNRNLSEDVVLQDIKDRSGIFMELAKNVSGILDYAFTEMLNNAIEHSRSPQIEIFMKRNSAKTEFIVVDRGVGIFKHIMRKRSLPNELEAIRDLLKGKQTTAPEEHTGEGIFFTSKAADRLTIKSGKKKLIFDNQLRDIFIEDIAHFKGTKVIFTIALNSPRSLDRIFKEYAGEAFEFGKTKIAVRLYKIDAAYISRSQARRIMAGLDKFKVVILDFYGVKTVGQAFADEVFRVWKKNHPEIEVRYRNANENVEFMIRRASSNP